MKHYFKTINTPVGNLTLVADADSLVGLVWNETELDRFPDREPKNSHVILKMAERQLKEYFNGKRTTFDLPYKFEGTDFQKRVWKALTRIPYGKKRSYAQLAKKIGKPKGFRAVGAANGRNPISIIVPCHRVIGSNGSLTGFGGGLGVKKFLLDLEAS